MSQPKQYQVHIDGLRAIAVLSVVFFHAAPSWVPGGFVGVDVFFVISGYLITLGLLADVSAKRFSLLRFYERRVRRLFPALLTLLVGLYGFGWFTLLAIEFELLGQHTLASLGFVQNLLLWTETGYFDQQSWEKPLLHLWSLGVEEQFYLVWPLVLLLLMRWVAGSKSVPAQAESRGQQNQQHSSRQAGFGKLFLLVAIILAASLVWSLVSMATDPQGAYFSPLARAWELLAGALLAFAQHYSPHLFKMNSCRHEVSMASQGVGSNIKRWCGERPLAKEGLLWLSLFSLLASFWLIHEGRDFPGWWALIPVLATVGVLAFAPSSNIAMRILAHPVLVWVGVISYPLYLWHWPLLSMPQLILAERPSMEIRASAVVVAFLLAWLTYRWIERPFRYGPLKSHAAPLLLSGAIAMAGLGGLTWQFDGIAERDSVRVLSLMTQDLVDELEAEDTGLCDRLNSGVFCTGYADSPASVLVGDSHARALFPGMREVLHRTGESLLLVSAPGCPPLMGVWSSETPDLDQRHCIERMSDSLEFLASVPDITTFYLTGRGPLYTTGRGFGNYRDNYQGLWTLKWAEAVGDQRDEQTKSNVEVYELGLRKTLLTLNKAGKRVIFIHDVPELGFDIRSCMPSRPLAPPSYQRHPCGVTVAVFNERYQSFQHLVESVLADFPSVEQKYLASAFCDDALCQGANDKRLFYRDDDHLSAYGSLKAAQAILD
jgi:peptidoglycan/LPS O-acetylase OafA/YrhL